MHTGPLNKKRGMNMLKGKMRQTNTNTREEAVSQMINKTFQIFHSMDVKTYRHWETHTWIVSRYLESSWKSSSFHVVASKTNGGVTSTALVCRNLSSVTSHNIQTHTPPKLIRYNTVTWTLNWFICAIIYKSAFLFHSVSLVSFEDRRKNLYHNTRRCISIK